MSTLGANSGDLLGLYNSRATDSGSGGAHTLGVYSRGLQCGASMIFVLQIVSKKYEDPSTCVVWGISIENKRP